MSDVVFTSWGSADSIGPSCHVLAFGSYRVGIDYGAGIRESAPRPLYDGPLDALLVTHAHRDHIGLLPVAASRWPRARMFATYETMSLARWIWDDELSICRAEGRTLPFRPEDIDLASRRTKRLVAGTSVRLTEDLEITPFPAGHILGAVGFDLCYRGEHIIATGDISLRSHAFIAGAVPPAVSGVRALIRESTYVGQYPIGTRSDTAQALVDRVLNALEGGGRVLIPTLSIDRMAEIYTLLRGHGVDRQWPLWVVGGARPSEIYRDYAPGGHLLRPMRRFENRQHQDDVRKSGEPVVVLASSGMVAPNSPSYTWAVDLADDPASAIFFVNWQDPGMLGGRLLSAADGDRIELPSGGKLTKRCMTQRFDFSTHAKEDEMEELEERLAPRQIVHIHGEGTNTSAFIAARAGQGPPRIMAEVGVPIAL